MWAALHAHIDLLRFIVRTETEIFKTFLFNLLRQHFSYTACDH